MILFSLNTINIMISTVLCLTKSFLLSLQTDSRRPIMSFIQAFLQQTVYMGMPDDSVRVSVVLFQLPWPTTLFFFSFFIFLCWWKFLVRQFRASKREREKCGVSSEREKKE